ncbi:MAG: glycosylase [Clostridia bacterium]|nr:glycosylase [Clostridia bacterium]
MKHWLKNAVFYEIYPQSFNDTNADGIGDFEGIIEKLDYIRDMGFTAIWMNPCYDSPFTDAGYDVRNYYKTAERYGTNDDLKRLFDEVHKRDMHIIIDLVPGHTSIDCEWFKESMKAERNEYSDRYIWTDNIKKSLDGIADISGSLRGISNRDGSCGVNYYSTQPALNYGFANPTETWQCAVDSQAALSTRAEILNVIRFWLNLGCDGYRVDMAASLIKNDIEKTEMIKFWQEMFAVIRKEFPEAVFVSEWGDPSKALVAGFDMDFLLHFGPSHFLDMYHSENPYFSENGAGYAEDFFAYYLDSYNKTKGIGSICLISGNHDMPRIAHFCSETEIKLVYAFMMSMPGIPFIYYGDEIGMKYLDGITSVEGGYWRTGARSPMQWNGGKNSGFSDADADKLYIMQDPDPERPTAEKQMKDENSILNELKRQIAVRKNNNTLAENGGFELINSGYPLVYRRYTDEKDVLVAINPKNEECSVDTAAELGRVVYELNGAAHTENGKLIVPPCSASYIEIKGF